MLPYGHLQTEDCKYMENMGLYKTPENIENVSCSVNGAFKGYQDTT